MNFFNNSRATDYDREGDNLCPITSYVKPKNSSFSVNVPNYFCRNNDNSPRKLFIANLMFIPEFYDVKSAELNLDPSEETDIKHKNKLTLSYNADSILYPKLFNIFNHTNPNLSPDELVKEINMYFDNFKTAGMKHTPFFVDWVDSSMNETEGYEMSGYEFDNEVPQLGETYYEETYNEEKHLNALSIFARTLQFTNNYALPNFKLPGSRDCRLRFWLAPNTEIEFSHKLTLYRLGFDVEQFEFPKDRKMILTNRATTGWYTVIANNLPKFEMLEQKTLSSRITIKPVNKSVSANGFVLEMKRGEWFKPAAFKKEFRKFIQSVGSESNINLQLQESDNTISLKFTDELTAIDLQIFTDTELASKLGYGPTSVINKNSVAVAETSAEIEFKTKVQSYNTGSAFITVENTSSHQSTAANEKIVATLYFNEDGLMCIPLQPYYLEPPFFEAPSFTMGIYDTDIVFNLWTEYPDKKRMPFQWNYGFQIRGELRSRV